MTVKDIVLPLPENLYLRLEQTARATKQSLTDVLVRTVADPPDWSQAPATFQADLAVLNRLFRRLLARFTQPAHRSRCRSASSIVGRERRRCPDADERLELDAQVTEADRFMLRKVHAATLLRARPCRAADSKRL